MLQGILPAGDDDNDVNNDNDHDADSTLMCSSANWL